MNQEEKAYLVGGAAILGLMAWIASAIVLPLAGAITGAVMAAGMAETTGMAVLYGIGGFMAGGYVGKLVWGLGTLAAKGVAAVGLAMAGFSGKAKDDAKNTGPDLTPRPSIDLVKNPSMADAGVKNDFDTAGQEKAPKSPQPKPPASNLTPPKP